ncbi:vWA domain-containing protein [Aporhodopirellula aestuarii]|uniref:VWA domain-containing protein n=1 Tax=Aporhodopirellula aestuarii TaxID=2950107 RepID=A0ABT0U565_9BACT|nr:VWA domain-containing protein [Aporhodopirellula aestuarii]MCM2372057.1 VWA domain-containing protein [Aporhodopirellula aestuarii]
MSPFAFQYPGMLLLIFLLLPVAWLLHRARQRRAAVRDQMGGGVPVSSTRRDGLRIAALLLLLLALARPGDQPRRHSVTQSGRDVVFVLDVSQSMLAEDAYPSRLEAAKDGIRDALDSFRSQRVALVVYAGSANILCPLTHDHEFVRYMLDQATPRVVDFGGTTLLSAIEKCVDNVLDPDRSGMQDLIVLTDGEEHGDQTERVAELLKENETGLLVVGLGDPTAGSRIPIETEDGKPDFLKHDGQIVTTKLNDEGLRELSRLSDDATYLAAGTSAFDLAGMYAQFALNKPIAGTAGGETYVVYRELSFPLITVALLLLLFAEFSGRGAASGLSPRRGPANAVTRLLWIPLLIIAGIQTAGADPPKLGRQFTAAVQMQNEGKAAEALDAYSVIDSEFPSDALTPSQIAAIRFNQGLCHLSLAEAQAEAEPRQALSQARFAQNRFLEACRMNPRFERAARRLDPTAELIADYVRLIEEEDERERQLQEQMQDLIKLLQELQTKQSELRDNVPDHSNRNNRPRRGQPPPEPPSPPDSAAEDSKRFAQSQRTLHNEGVSIRQIMKDLDQTISEVTAEPPSLPADFGDESQSTTVHSAPDPAPPVSVLQEPLQLMDQVVVAQEQAAGKLQQWNTWPEGRDQQLVAIKKIQEILDLLASNDSGESDEGDWDEDAEYDEMMEASDSEEAMMSSMQGQGDFASGSEMQSLPVPNYSVDDILMEEQGSLQFRQQQRAKGNQGNVEKDW